MSKSVLVSQKFNLIRLNSLIKEFLWTKKSSFTVTVSQLFYILKKHLNDASNCSYSRKF